MGAELKPRKNSVTEGEALERLSQRGFSALQPFPGNGELPWLVACSKCQRSKFIRLKKWKSIGCRHCSRGPSIEVFDELLNTSNMERLGIPDSSKKAKVRCKKCKETFSLDPSLAIKNKSAKCPYCSGKRLSRQEIKERIDSAGLEIVGNLPSHTQEKFLARCPHCKKIVEKTLSNLRDGKTYCRYCTKNSKIEEEKALSIYKAAGLTPITSFPGGKGGWKSRCDFCGEIVSPHYTSVKNGRGCKYCSGKAVNPQTAEELMRTHFFEPLEPYPGALKPWLVKCTKCQRESKPAFATVSSKGSGCKYCNPAGINLTEPAVFYFIAHPVFQAYKIGISGAKKSRVKTHIRGGWELILMLDLASGQDALDLEQAMKRWIRKVEKLPQYLGKEEMPQRGETETFAMSEIEANKVETYIYRCLALIESGEDPLKVHKLL